MWLCYNFITSTTIGSYKERKLHMKLKKPSRLILNKIGLCLIVFSTMIIKTACFAFIGEPEPPKSLLK